MNILQRQQEQGCLIEVLGQFNTGDNELLTNILLSHQNKPLELNLYDIKMLPESVLLALLLLSQQNINLKIRVYHHYLFHYLMRFKLPVFAMTPVNTPPTPNQTKAIVLGGSADSLDKILTIIETLPSSDCSIFIAQHFPEDACNQLDSLLKTRTDYRVVMPQQLSQIMPNSIYIAPPSYHMKVAHGLIYLTRDAKINYSRPSIEVLFQTVAEEYREQAICVLLCGYGNDGVAVIPRLKELGTTVLVEHSQDCFAKDLTQAAITGGHANLVLGLPELCCYLAAAAVGNTPEPSPHLLNLLLEALFYRYGYDYRHYQQSTVLRRLENLRQQLQLADFFTLQREILRDEEYFERLFLELSINVTEFFRHPQQMRILREQVLPYLASFSHLKIWSAGCASGEEVYSLAILLDELGLLEKSQLFATDINPYQLEEAHNGIYPIHNFARQEQNYIESGGKRQLSDWLHFGANHYAIDARIKKRVQFYSHSLNHDGPFQEFQLIVCRNVLIYFHPTLQGQVIQLFTRSLHQDGFLLLGPSERIEEEQSQNNDFTTEHAQLRLYRRRS